MNPPLTPHDDESSPQGRKSELSNAEPPAGEGRRSRRGLWISIVVVLVVAVASAVALLGWAEVYTRRFEPNPPEIVAVEVPRGIGLSPVTVRVDVRDQGAGLDEVVVRTRQRGRSKEVLRQSLGGRSSARVAIDFPGDKSDLEEGTVDLEVRAFDRSFWSNGTTKTFSFKVDFRRPRVEVLTAQHNARRGGAQLIIYRAVDEDIALSGVKSGDSLSPGFPARGLDRDFTDPSLFAAIFPVPFGSDATSPMQLYAEDAVGNTAGAGFYYRIGDRRTRPVRISVSEEFLRRTVPTLVEQSLPLLAAEGVNTDPNVLYKSARGSAERLSEQFNLLNGRMRLLNDEAIRRQLQGPRFERLWEGPIAKPVGTSLLAYGDMLNFNFGGQDMGSALLTGYAIGLPSGVSEVVAAADGVVTFSDSFPVPGRVVALDHGIGLSTVYGGLEQAFVGRGETVRRGQVLGRAGNTGMLAGGLLAGSGLGRAGQYYFEVRVHGVATAPEEWWEARWFEDHITGKVNEVKQSLGMAVLRPIRR